MEPKNCETDIEYFASLPSAEQHVVRLEDRKWNINTIIAGSGPAILLIHGFGTSWRWWQPVIDRLVASHTIIAIDLPGSGESTELTVAPEPSDYASVVDVVVRRFGPLWIAGHSLGGFAALQSVMRGVPGIKGVFLSAPAGFGRIENNYLRSLGVPVLGSALSRTGDKGLRLLLSSLVHNKSVTPQMLCWSDTSADSRDQFLFQLRLGIDWLGRTNPKLIIDPPQPFPVPLKLVWGQHDSLFPISTGYEAADKLGIQDLLIGVHSGHFVHLEEPDWFASELEQFVNTTE